MINEQCLLSFFKLFDPNFLKHSTCHKVYDIKNRLIDTVKRLSISTTCIVISKDTNKI